jgi:hypothetical protein
MLETLIYSSSASGDRLTDEALEEILDVSRRNNAAAGVTGLLMYAEGAFLQVLEGEAADVKDTFVRILGDKRHSRILKLYKGPIRRRNFPDWSMGYRDGRPGELPSAFFTLSGERLSAFQQSGMSEDIFLLLKSFYRNAYRYEAV